MPPASARRQTSDVPAAPWKVSESSGSMAETAGIVAADDAAAMLDVTVAPLATNRTVTNDAGWAASVAGFKEE